MKSAKSIKIVDTTLRDGEQTPGVAFSVDEKIAIAVELDRAGVPAIEAGIPAMGGKELTAVTEIARLGLKAEIIAWNRGELSDIKASIACGVSRVHISLPVSDMQIEHKLNRDRGWVLAKLSESVRYAKSHGVNVSVGAEDATRSDWEFLTEYMEVAESLGVDRFRYCDTVGILDPMMVYENVRELCNSTSMAIEMHAHNDFGLATANALMAVQAGAAFVDTTVSGLGERAGNTALEELVMALRHVYKANTGIKAENLSILAEMVSKSSGRLIPVAKPIVGEEVFYHESGIHTDGVLKMPSNYEPFEPEEVGRHRELVIGKHSGRAVIRNKLAEYGIEINPKDASKLLEIVRDTAIRTKKTISGKELLGLYSSGLMRVSGC